MATTALLAASLSGCSGVPRPSGEDSGTANERNACRAELAPQRSGAPHQTGWPLDALRLPPRSVAEGDGVTVAVIDSGLSPGAVPDERVHPSSRSFVASEALSDDGGHGTQMASLVHEVAPAARILALKAVDAAGYGRAETIEAGVRFAITEGADVVSLSLETGGPGDGLLDALRAATDAGIVLVVAAGNQQLDLDRFPRYPASYDLPLSLVVAAVDDAGDLTAATNWGATTVDVAAPGAGIPVETVDSSGSESVDVIRGSSPGAALVAGSVALLLGGSDGSSGAAERVVEVVVATAQPREALDGRTVSGGQIDVAAALDCMGVLAR